MRYAPASSAVPGCPQPAVDPPATRLVAVCGIDGAGKTTVIEELMRSPLVPNTIALRKVRSPNAARVLRSWPVSVADDRGIVGVRDAGRLGMAYALDFRIFYRREVAAHVGRRDLILLDRWRPCVAAVADMTGADATRIESIISGVPPADLVVFLRVEPEEARRRIELRGAPKFDEDLSTLFAFQASYERILRDYPGPIVELANNDLERTVAEARTVLRMLLDGSAGLSDQVRARVVACFS